jgi:hypothetical protein
MASNINVVLSRPQTYSDINVQIANRRNQVLINQATATVKNLNDLLDVDADNPIDGAVLVYNAATQRYELSLNLDKQDFDIDGGTY